MTPKKRRSCPVCQKSMRAFVGRTKYCSPVCRTLARNNKPPKVNKSGPFVDCEICWSLFTPQTYGVKLCSDACRLIKRRLDKQGLTSADLNLQRGARQRMRDDVREQIYARAAAKFARRG